MQALNHKTEQVRHDEDDDDNVDDELCSNKFNQGIFICSRNQDTNYRIKDNITFMTDDKSRLSSDR